MRVRDAGTDLMDWAQQVDAAELRAIQIELARRHLRDFAEMMLGFPLDPWQVHLCERLEAFVEAIERGESPRMMVFAPPQCGKSTIVARAFVAWVIGRHPEWPEMVGTYGQTLANKHGRWIRNTLRSEEYLAVFPNAQLAGDSQAKDEMAFSGGGQLLCRGVGGGLTGNPSMLTVIDDPFKDRQQAESALERENVWDWYTSVVTTRLGPGAGVLVMHTRWHTADLAGQLQHAATLDPDADQWELVNYAAIIEPHEQADHPNGCYRPDGSLACRFSKQDFLKRKANLPSRDWLSLYQQTPKDAEGTVFKLKWIHEERPPAIWQYIIDGQGQTVPKAHWPLVYQAWDLAGTKAEAKEHTDGCFSVGGAFIHDWIGRWWLIDLVRGKWSGGELAEQIINFAWKWRAQIVWGEDPIAMYQQDYLIQRMQDSGKHFRWKRCNVQGRGDKQARAEASAVPPMQNGCFYVPAGAPWLPKFRTELSEFPVGSYKDQVDMLSLGFYEAMGVAKQTPQPAMLVSPSDTTAITWADVDDEDEHAPTKRRRSPWLKGRR